MKPIARVILALGLLGALPAFAQEPKPVVEEGVVYGKAGNTELKLDLARPVGSGPFPAIVFIHGGGWYSGNREGYRPQIEEAARRGYVAVRSAID